MPAAMPAAEVAMDLGSHARLVKWSLRKLRLGIRPGDLTLDVGSGANPHPRADVLLERYLDGHHRHGVPAVADRPMVFADACATPFRDKAFDFVMAFHVLEHMPDPAGFLREISRIGKAGYIETPNVVSERLVPHDVHVLEVMDLDGRLFIQKKARPATDEFMHRLALNQRSQAWRRFFYGAPELLHVRFFWKDVIPFEIVNPDEECAWFMNQPATNEEPHVTDSIALGNWRSRGLAALRKLNALRRSKPVRLEDMLVCPSCHGALQLLGEFFECRACRVRFPAFPHPNFTGASPI